ncbi:MAG: permease [Blastococcus sp.]|nr:permease [Blastococcus sp.]
MVRPAARSGGTAEAIPAPRSAASAWALRTGAVRGLLTDRPTRPPSRRTAVAGVLLALTIAAAALLWAKWLPYEAKAVTLSGTHTWKGSSILAVGGVHPGDAPTWHAATTFFTTYVLAIWKALVAALLISAAVQAFVPRTWLLRLLNRRGTVRSAAAGGLASTPSLMCTCCTAPVAATLRRDGVSTAAALAYWLGNPLLNPAVLVFLAFVTPWQWTLTRIVVGLLVVVGGSALVARLTARRELPVSQVAPEPEAGDWFAQAPERFVRTLVRLLLTLVPEYLLVVLALGAFRGWLFPIGGHGLGAGAAVMVVAAVVGTLLVIPTGGEIPILQALALAGLSLGTVGALLLTLPAASLPAIAMVGRAFGWRTTWATAATVAAGGLVAGGLLLALPT